MHATALTQDELTKGPNTQQDLDQNHDWPSEKSDDYVYKSPILSLLHQRGFLHQLTHKRELDEAFLEKPMVAYMGCDATAPSLHVGNLLGLMAMRWLKDMGHTPVLLIGGATTKIGDPSGRDTQRQLLDDNTIQANIQGITRCFKNILGPDVTIVNNADWLDRLSYIDMLRIVGPLFSVARMLTMESARLRLQRCQPFSFLEFNYPILQAYDFWQLFKSHGCTLQLGGADQWGNMLSGMDIIRRKERQASYALTWPLMETASGKKMGKSVDGALWLDKNLCDPYTYWQFWRTCDDADVMRFLRLYTLVPLEELNQRFSHLQGQELSGAKIFLADWATAFLHGQDSLDLIHRARNLAFSRPLDVSGAPWFCPTSIDVKEFSLPQVCGTFCGLPWRALSLGQWCQGESILNLAMDLGLFPSRSQGRTHINNGALRINGHVVRNGEQSLCFQDIQTSEAHDALAWAKAHPCPPGHVWAWHFSFGSKRHGFVYLKP